MSTFFKFFYEFFMAFCSAVLGLIQNFFVNVWNIINLGRYAEIFKAYMRDFTWYEWIFAILTLLIAVALIVLAVYLCVLSICNSVKKRRARMDKQALVAQVEALNHKVLKLVDEKDKIMAMQVSRLGVQKGAQDGADLHSDESLARMGTQSRFIKLTEVDRKYNCLPQRLTEKEDYDLKTLIKAFLGFANHSLNLYYTEETVRCFIAGMAGSRLIILEGISGTGKTSLPYALGKFLKNETAIVPVQPSWRDKTELVGYFNEFTKRFNETEFLKSVYEKTYREDIGFIVLDEMNLSRVEYYFASVLSILEMPNRDEWKMEIVSDTWESDPKHLTEGKIRFPANVWFVGTANQDDSTFTITDKVYDRAVPIALNSKGRPFDIEPSPAQSVSLKKLEELFLQARQNHPLSAEIKKKFDKLDDFMIEKFRLAFGNRILKQLNEFVPVYVAAGGTESDGVDFILTGKILRKLEGLNLSFVQESLKETVELIDALFGKKAMPLSKAYLKGLIKKA